MTCTREDDTLCRMKDPDGIIYSQSMVAYV